MFKLFSVDDHVVEHPRVWTDRVSAKYRDLAPHIVVDGGYEWWEYEDQRGGTTGLNAVAGKPPDHWNIDPLRFDDMIPGCYDPKARTNDMLANGILASVCFPTLPRFGGVLFYTFKDKDLALECVKAYNDFMIDEWCAGGPPGLYVPMIIAPLWDAQLAAEETERCVEKGAKAICLPDNPSNLGMPSFYTDFWDPLMGVVQDADIPICMHIGSGGYLPPSPPEASYLNLIAIGVVSVQLSVIDLVFSPVCRKFPKLKFVYSEGGIGWMPSTFERADRHYKLHRNWIDVHDKAPSEIYRENIFLCMLDEPQALRTVRHEIGIDKIMWECDYPHSESPWPYTQEKVAETFAGIPDDEIELMLYKNAERIFNWQMADPALVVQATPIPPFEWEERRTPPERVPSIVDSSGVRRCRHLAVHGMDTGFCNREVVDGVCPEGHLDLEEPATASV